MKIERGSTRSRSVENSLWKNLWIYLMTDKQNEYRKKDEKVYMF